MSADSIKSYLLSLLGKLFGLLKSRKWWALVTAVVVVAQGVALGDITQWQAAQALIAALMVYTGATALEDGLSRKA